MTLHFYTDFFYAVAVPYQTTNLCALNLPNNITETGARKIVPENGATKLLWIKQQNDNKHFTFQCKYYMGVEHKVNWYFYLPVKTLGTFDVNSDAYFDVDNKYDAEKKIMTSTLKVVSQK